MRPSDLAHSCTSVLPAYAVLCAQTSMAQVTTEGVEAVVTAGQS